MNRKKLCLLTVLLVLGVAVAGCVGQAPAGETTTTIPEKIESADQAGAAVKGISESIGDLQADLSDIDKSLG